MKFVEPPMAHGVLGLIPRVVHIFPSSLCVPPSCNLDLVTKVP